MTTNPSIESEGYNLGVILGSFAGLAYDMLGVVVGINFFGGGIGGDMKKCRDKICYWCRNVTIRSVNVDENTYPYIRECANIILKRYGDAQLTYLAAFFCTDMKVFVFPDHSCKSFKECYAAKGREPFAFVSRDYIEKNILDLYFVEEDVKVWIDKRDKK